MPCCRQKAFATVCSSALASLFTIHPCSSPRFRPVVRLQPPPPLGRRPVLGWPPIPSAAMVASSVTLGRGIAPSPWSMLMPWATGNQSAGVTILLYWGILATGNDSIYPSLILCRPSASLSGTQVLLDRYNRSMFRYPRADTPTTYGFAMFGIEVGLLLSIGNNLDGCVKSLSSWGPGVLFMFALPANP